MPVFVSVLLLMIKWRHNMVVWWKCCGPTCRRRVDPQQLWQEDRHINKLASICFQKLKKVKFADKNKESTWLYDFFKLAQCYWQWFSRLIGDLFGYRRQARDFHWKFDRLSHATALHKLGIYRFPNFYLENKNESAMLIVSKSGGIFRVL